MSKTKMRDGLVQRGKGRWTAVLHLGFSEPDPTTGRRKILQRWVSLGRCTRQEAKARRDELQVAVRKDEFVAPNRKLSVGEWLNTWLDEAVRPARRQNTVACYTQAITKHLTPALGGIPLQALRPGHIQAYHATKRKEGFANGTIALHHIVLSAALRSAVRQNLVAKNVATLVEGRSRPSTGREAAKDCWTGDEARAFLRAAEGAGAQWSALFALAVDSGARRGELLGLRWSDIDLEAGTIAIDRQLLVSKSGTTVFGPTKTGRPRTIDITTVTIARLKSHRANQAAIKMKNRTVYRDGGLVFAFDDATRRTATCELGGPLSPSGLAPVMDRLAKQARVRRIKFHALRHTSATLLLSAGEPPHVVAARLGHNSAVTTMAVYAHCLKPHSRRAAEVLGALLA